MFQQLQEKRTSLAVIGLGYVGLPVALAFAEHFSVIGYDINVDLVKELQGNKQYNSETIIFTNEAAALSKASFFIVTVPTPVNKYNVPDLGPLTIASTQIGKALKRGDYVVYESTTYPGCTEEDCLPILEKCSGLTLGKDFKLGYSPERINVGDTKNTLQNVVKVVSGSDEEALQEIAQVYSLIITAGIFKAPSIKVAEASKIVENTQRDMNISLMNELSMIFDKMGVNTFDVIEAASTKWNFLRFQPGLVGGHCIGVDPYYLTYKAASLGYESKVIAASRFINDDMAKYVARKIITHVLRTTNEPKVLVKGVTFKENVSDIRNSKIVDTVKELLAFNIKVDVEDPFAKQEDVQLQYGLKLVENESDDYDAIVVTIPHDAYVNLDENYFITHTKPNALIVDLKGIYRNKINHRKYWSL
ncbi:nucleotide sugar dehydrogenase [Pinibacter aurantiacus]|uniref:Nucleotide sugar dehydrogenase n=1 Tax=Pinibacter aurantiacus TaxID=2851599 RepID=A0A9E2SBF5_9BACT|nr:nucleotide sugar dehydrogenase [Pinibacter aurantiacus]MBV4358344.1 nucleotide sugar dehydrogenase [Pinibacter aurantiacus]